MQAYVSQWRVFRFGSFEIHGMKVKFTRSLNVFVTKEWEHSFRGKFAVLCMTAYYSRYE